MLVTNRDDIAEKVRLKRSHGMTSLTWDRHHGHAYSYDVVDLGYNYRLDEIRSALGIIQLNKLSKNNSNSERRSRKITGLTFRKTPLELPFSKWSKDKSVVSAYHIFPVLLPEGVNREKFVTNMHEAGIQTSVHYPPIHLFSFYKKNYQDVYAPITENLASREVTLPLYASMEKEAVELVIQGMLNSLEMIT